MDRVLASIIVLLCYFSEGLTENVGFKSNLLESHRLRSLLARNLHKREENRHPPPRLHHHHHHLANSQNQPGNFFDRPSPDRPLKHHPGRLNTDHTMHATESTKKRRSTTTTTTTKPPSTTKEPFTVQAVPSANCHDQVSNCETYGPQICRDLADWARHQCQKYCVVCVPIPTTTTIPPPSTTVKMQWLHVNGR